MGENQMKKLLLVVCVLAATTLTGCSYQEVTGSAENVVIKFNAMGAPVFYWDVREGVSEGDSNIVSWSNPGQDRTYVTGDLVVEPVSGNLAEIVQEYNLEKTPHISAP